MGSSGQFWFWAYDINFHRYQYFYDSIHNIGDNMKGFKKIGVQYLLMQGAHECLNEWQCNMRAYVYNKLMWNGEQDADALLKEYRDLYYGPASDAVNRVIEHFHAHYKKLVDEGTDLWFITRGNCEEAAITPLPVLYKAIEIIEEGEADVILAFERLESLRWAHYLKKGGKILYSSQEIMPMPVLTGAAEYPARSTASQMSWSERAVSSKSTVMEPESRFTATFSTPASRLT